MRAVRDPHHRHRFPAEIIAHAVWLYHAFTLSFRAVELLPAARGVVLCYETIRRWWLKFAQRFANGLCRRRPRPGDKWHLDVVFLRIRGKRRCLWRAVNQDGTVLDILVRSRRHTKAAKRLFKKLLKGLQYVPRVVMTDRLRSQGEAKRATLPGVEHRKSRHLNNRAENSPQPTRRRERQMQRFKSAAQAQRFLSAHGPIRQHVHPPRQRMPAAACRTRLTVAFRAGSEVTCVRAMAWGEANPQAKPRARPPAIDVTTPSCVTAASARAGSSW